MCKTESKAKTLLQVRKSKKEKILKQSKLNLVDEEVEEVNLVDEGIKKLSQKNFKKINFSKSKFHIDCMNFDLIIAYFTYKLRYV